MDYTILDAAKELHSRHSSGTRRFSGFGRKLDDYLPTALADDITDVNEFLLGLAGPDGFTQTDLNSLVFPLLKIANGHPFNLEINPSDEALFFRKSVPTDAQRDIPESYLYKEAKNWGGTIGCGFCFALAGLKPGEWTEVVRLDGDVLVTENRSVQLSQKLKKLFDEKELFTPDGPADALKKLVGMQPSRTHAGQVIQRKWQAAMKGGLRLRPNQIRYCSAVSELGAKGLLVLDDVAERIGISAKSLERHLKRWNKPGVSLISQTTYDAIFG